MNFERILSTEFSTQAKADQASIISSFILNLETKFDYFLSKNSYNNGKSYRKEIAMRLIQDPMKIYNYSLQFRTNYNEKLYSRPYLKSNIVNSIQWVSQVMENSNIEK